MTSREEKFLKKIFKERKNKKVKSIDNTFSVPGDQYFMLFQEYGPDTTLHYEFGNGNKEYRIAGSVDRKVVYRAKSGNYIIYSNAPVGGGDYIRLNNHDKFPKYYDEVKSGKFKGRLVLNKRRVFDDIVTKPENFYKKGNVNTTLYNLATQVENINRDYKVNNNIAPRGGIRINDVAKYQIAATAYDEVYDYIQDLYTNYENSKTKKERQLNRNIITNKAEFPQYDPILAYRSRIRNKKNTNAAPAYIVKQVRKSKVQKPKRARKLRKKSTKLRRANQIKKRNDFLSKVQSISSKDMNISYSNNNNEPSNNNNEPSYKRTLNKRSYDDLDITDYHVEPDGMQIVEVDYSPQTKKRKRD